MMLAMVAEGEAGYLEELERIEAKVSEARRRAGEPELQAPLWIRTRTASGKATYIWSTSNPRVYEAFIALGSERDTE